MGCFVQLCIDDGKNSASTLHDFSRFLTCFAKKYIL